MQCLIDGSVVFTSCKWCDFVRVITGFQVGFLLLTAFVFHVFGCVFHLVSTAWFVLLEGMVRIVTGELFGVKSLLRFWDVLVVFFQVCIHDFLERFEIRLVRTV